MTALHQGWIIARRDLAQWARQPMIPIFGLLFTVMLLLMFAFILGGAITVPGGGDYIAFLLPGMFALTMMFGIERTTTAMAGDAKLGITDRFRSLPISSSAVSLGRAGADMVHSVVELAVLIGGGLLIGWRITGSPVEAVLAVVLLLWLRFALLWVGIYLGLAFGNAATVTMVQVLVWPIGFLSNVFVATETMPGWLGAIADWNPISATATAARQLFGNPTGISAGWTSEQAVLLAVLWPAVIVAVFMPLSAFAYRRLRR